MTAQDSTLATDGDIEQSLAERVRPTDWSAFVGQDELLGEAGEIGAAVADGRIDSLLLCGPRGCGKSTLARLVAETLGWCYFALDARTATIGDIRDAFDAAVAAHKDGWPGVILFVDAIDSLSLIASDALLICAEDGAMPFIGGTTDPRIADDDTAPLSRLPCYQFDELGSAGIRRIVDRVLADEGSGLGGHAMQLDEAARDRIAVQAAGEAGWAIERLATIATRFDARQPESATVTPDIVDSLLADSEDTARDSAAIAADNETASGAGDSESVDETEAVVDDGESASVADGAAEQPAAGEVSDADASAQTAPLEPVDAMRQCILASDSDAARRSLRLALEAGYSIDDLGRVLLRMASENVGNADPGALRVVLDASDAAARLGGFDGEPALAQAAEYLARAPKQAS